MSGKGWSKWQSVLLALLVPAWLTPTKVAAACNCSGVPSAVVLPNLTLQRCLQRCRDAVGGCGGAAFQATDSCCALGVGQSSCGEGWTAQVLPSGCPFGQGTPLLGGSCADCSEGSASHIDVGDLAGVWQLQDVNGAAAGVLTVATGGEAVYSGGGGGRFVLWHPRADPRYPGAFFLEREAQAGDVGLGPGTGPGPGWEYAWLEDRTSGKQLVVRRFCAAGPRCGQASSPEGSPLFQQTLLGQRSADVPCTLLEGVSSAQEGGLDSCCAAANATAEVLNQKFTASVRIAGGASWPFLELVNATWNSPPYTPFQSAGLSFNATDPELCSYGVNASAGTRTVVALARRGVCAFAQKAAVAHAAGMQGLIVVNLAGQPLPEFLRNADGATSDPEVPTWMIAAEAGEEVLTALSQNSGPTAPEATVEIGRLQSFDSGSLQALCCSATCRARVELAAAQGRAGGVNVSSSCPGVGCTGAGAAVSSPAPAEPVTLPRSSASCAACPAGLVALAAGSAHCMPCGDGQMAATGGATCEPCAAGTAGLAGSCAACEAGLVPDPLSRSCISPPTAAPTPPPPSCPTCPESTSCPTAAPVNPGSQQSDQPTIITVTQASSFNWGTLFGVLFMLFSLLGLGWLLRKMYLSYQQTGAIDTLAILRTTCGSLFSFGAVLATAGRAARDGKSAAASATASGEEASGQAKDATPGQQGTRGEEGRRRGRGSKRNDEGDEAGEAEMGEAGDREVEDVASRRSGGQRAGRRGSPSTP